MFKKLILTQNEFTWFAFSNDGLNLNLLLKMYKLKLIAVNHHYYPEL